MKCRIKIPSIAPDTPKLLLYLQFELAMETLQPIKYNLYIDECGDHVLTAFDSNFPVFTLCGILIPTKKLNSIQYSIDLLKKEFWGTTDVILHSRDIRKCEKQFQILFDEKIKLQFYARLNEILSQRGIYYIVCCSVQKEACVYKYGKNADVYGTALKYVIQRSIFCVDDNNPEGVTISITVEKRGKKENASLLTYYNRLRETGMHYVSPERLTKHISGFEFKDKKENICGLQIADLVAYPISRHVLNPDKSNPAFDIIKPNIYFHNGNLLGLKIYPDK